VLLAALKQQLPASECKKAAAQCCQLSSRRHNDLPHALLQQLLVLPAALMQQLPAKARRTRRRKIVASQVALACYNADTRNAS
jgi:hypothetical protein